MATIRDIAKACGVSAMTVSAVLNKRHGAASTETRDRILRVVDEMGYHPNAVARALTRRYTGTIGIVIVYQHGDSLTGDRYFGPVLDGVFEACKRQGQRALMITEETWEEAHDNLNSYFDGHCDGLIFVLPLLSDEFLVSVQRQNIPFVIIGETRSVPSLSMVDLDNVSAGYDATRYLIEAGHRRIAHIMGSAFFLSASQRETGYRQALTECDIPFDPSLVFQGHYTQQSGLEQGRELLTTLDGRLPTAIFCGDDWIALGALNALAERGLSVPGDISVVGVNNDKETVSTPPGITTIDHPLRLIGSRATEAVLRRIREKTPSGEQILVRGALVERGSVARLPAMAFERSGSVAVPQ